MSEEVTIHIPRAIRKWFEENATPTHGDTFEEQLTHFIVDWVRHEQRSGSPVKVKPLPGVDDVESAPPLRTPNDAKRWTLPEPPPRGRWKRKRSHGTEGNTVFC